MSMPNKQHVLAYESMRPILTFENHACQVTVLPDEHVSPKFGIAMLIKYLNIYFFSFIYFLLI